ncbi:MAG: Heterodimeric efflux ABC transporter, permease/ATP-binding subunit 2 [Ktedonobacterales bacterium]|nr:MAG: Heterodimeric efflux ABC transporter, permease/ATP-binding subunit 2 [Ktedonobacterales bacterium]
MAQTTFFHEDEILGKAYDGRLMRRLWRYIRPYSLLFFGALVIALATVGADLIGPFITQIAIDRYIAPAGPTTLTPTERANGVFFMSLLFLLALSVGFVLRYLQNFMLSVLGQKVMYDLRSDMFGHLQRLSLSFFDHNPVGRLMTRITNDVDALNDFFTSGAVSLIGDTLTLIGIMIILLIENWRLALVVFIVIPPLLLVTAFFQRAMRDNFRAIRVRLARINANIAENIAGTQVVQLFNRERRNFGYFDTLNRDYRSATLRSLFYFALFFPVVNLFAATATALIIRVGGGQVLTSALTIGALIAFLQYLDRFFLPVRDLADKYTILQAAMASSERIFRVLDEPVTIADPTTPAKLEQVQGDVQFRDVWFAYNPDEWVLKGISFHIRPGESVAFVGATGAGKTSLISLISRFYDVERGEVLLDGHNVKDLSQAELRRHVGAVLQDPFVFAGTIASNIRLHEQDIGDERVRDAASFVNAAPFIEQLPQMYEEEVRERGAGLSVGQKQLLAFARAIAFNPEVLLILDEATSSVDTETEALIQDALAKLMRGRTSIIIAHRLSTIRNVDRIIVLHKGRIVEEGTHEALLDRNGYYKRLYELQYAESLAQGA